MTGTPQLDAIVSGDGAKFSEYGRYRHKDLADQIVCNGGARLSAQASQTHYCTPRVDDGPYSKVEVGYPDPAPPESWAKYADGDYPSDMYGYVPVELVREYIVSHGGEKE